MPIQRSKRRRIIQSVCIKCLLVVTLLPARYTLIRTMPHGAAIRSHLLQTMSTKEREGPRDPNTPLHCSLGCFRSSISNFLSPAIATMKSFSCLLVSSLFMASFGTQSANASVEHVHRSLRTAGSGSDAEIFDASGSIGGSPPTRGSGFGFGSGGFPAGSGMGGDAPNAGGSSFGFERIFGGSGMGHNAGGSRFGSGMSGSDSSPMGSGTPVGSGGFPSSIGSESADLDATRKLTVEASSSEGSIVGTVRAFGGSSTGEKPSGS